MPETDGLTSTVNGLGLLAAPPAFTTISPVAAASGTYTTISVSLQEDAMPAPKPPKVIVPAP